MAEPIFITREEAVEILRIGENNVQKLCITKYKDFPVIKNGRGYLINLVMLNEWARKVTQEGDDLFCGTSNA